MDRVDEETEEIAGGTRDLNQESQTDFRPRGFTQKRKAKK